MENKVTKASILFVDDEPGVLSSLKRTMRSTQYECYFADSGKDALEMMESHDIDIIVSDMQMPAMDGAELLSRIAEKFPETIRMILSGYSDNESILAAINEGRVWGYISKPWDDAQLKQTLEHAVQTQQIISERSLLRRALDSYEKNVKSQFMGFVGSSLPMQFVYNSIENAGPSRASVFITGPSGAGKEVAAKALHDLSPRKGKEFLAINCAAIPSELMESEIFGHVKGAFSGALSNRDGAASIADGGTLFLDELAEMDINLQAKLLRFIQTGEYQKVGSNKVEKADIRFISATNQNPLQAIKNKELREDLYYRLNVISLKMPAVSERGEDKIKLAYFFLQRIADIEDKNVIGFSNDAEKLILEYHWPGNVRQLQNCVHNAVVMCQGSLIEKTNILQFISAEDDAYQEEFVDARDTEEVSQTNKLESSASVTTVNIPYQNGEILPLSEIEKQAIKRAIMFCEDNVVKAASMLEVSPSTLYRKMQNWQD